MHLLIKDERAGGRTGGLTGGQTDGRADAQKGGLGPVVEDAGDRWGPDDDVLYLDERAPMNALDALEALSIAIHMAGGMQKQRSFNVLQLNFR